MFADEIRRAIEASSRITLPQVTALLWRAYGEGHVTETEAETLSGLIEARTDAPAARRLPAGLRPSPEAAIAPTFQDGAGAPRRAVGSRPRTEASLERRRRWAASGRLPPGLAARFTLAEQAVLALVATETSKRGDCRWQSVSSRRRRGGRDHRPQRPARGQETWARHRRGAAGDRFRNDTNVVRIVSPEWQAWMRVARKPGRELRAVGIAGPHRAVGEGANPRSARLLSYNPIRIGGNGTVERLPRSSGRPRPKRAHANPRGSWNGPSHALSA